MYARIQAVYERRTNTNGISKRKQTQQVLFIRESCQSLSWRLTQRIIQKDALVGAGPTLH